MAVRNHPSYTSWNGMIRRCTNPERPDYPRYGGRGITVCPEWMTFEGFLADMGVRPEGLTLDRIDNNKGYCKENCRWATRKQQNNNMRTNHLLVHQGRVQTLAEWAQEIGIGPHTLYCRIVKHGWSIERALTTPVTPLKPITFNGKTMLMSEWARELGIRQLTLQKRLRMGWSISRALTTPVNGSKIF